MGIRKSWVAIAAALLVTTALAADDTLDQDLSRGQALATIAGESIGALVILGGFLWRPYQRRRRRLGRDRLEREARIDNERRSAEDRHIDARIDRALAAFRKTVVEAEMSATLNAVKVTLDTHTRDAQDQIRQVSGTVETLARGVAEIATRMETRCNQTNERMDDFLRAMAIGAMPHFRAAPRPLGETEG